MSIPKPGRYQELQTRVRRGVAGKDVPVLFVYAFDRRTRLGPFVFVDKKLVPGGPDRRCLGSGGCRIREQPGCPPAVEPPHPAEPGPDRRQAAELLLVSSMQIHSAPAYRLIDDAYKLGEHRPLILAGGAKAIYEPWDFFGLGPDVRQGADVVVTGEEFVLLELLDRLLEFKAQRETAAGVTRRRPGGTRGHTRPGLPPRRGRGADTRTDEHGRPAAGPRPG